MYLGFNERRKEMHVCLNCYEKYNSNLIQKSDGYESPCPKIDCYGSIVELDELIAPTIITLNQKGYLTKFCCSGHWYADLNPYIYFYDYCMPKEIPKPFSKEYNSEEIPTTMRARYSKNEKESRYEFVLRINKELYEWATNLPYNEY